jgi:hypothetical protein
VSGRRLGRCGPWQGLQLRFCTVALRAPSGSLPPVLTTPTPPPSKIHVLNGEKYREVCPDNTLLDTSQLRSCILLPQQKKPLLKREGGINVTEDGRILLVPEVRRAGRGGGGQPEGCFLGSCGQGPSPFRLQLRGCR